MSDQRRTTLAQPHADASEPSAQRARSATALFKLAGFRQRLPFYVGGVLAAIGVLAWIDGGEEPLHPIAQAVTLKAPGVQPQ